MDERDNYRGKGIVASISSDKAVRCTSLKND